MKMLRKVWDYFVALVIGLVVLNGVRNQVNSSTLSRGDDDSWMVFAVIGLLLLFAVWRCCG